MGHTRAQSSHQPRCYPAGYVCRARRRTDHHPGSGGNSICSGVTGGGAATSGGGAVSTHFTVLATALAGRLHPSPAVGGADGGGAGTAGGSRATGEGGDGRRAGPARRRADGDSARTADGCRATGEGGSGRRAGPSQLQQRQRHSPPGIARLYIPGSRAAAEHCAGTRATAAPPGPATGASFLEQPRA